MILHGRVVLVGDVRKPRASGDDPSLYPDGGLQLGVNPARAGMIPLRPLPAARRSWVNPARAGMIPRVAVTLITI